MLLETTIQELISTPDDTHTTEDTEALQTLSRSIGSLPCTCHLSDQPSSALNQRIEKLYPRLNRTAAHVFYGQPVPMVEQEDIAQEMALRIIERVNQLPGRLDQTDAYLMIDAVRCAGNRACSNEIMYSKYVKPENALSKGNDDEDEDPVNWEEFYNTSQPSIEDTIEKRMMLETIKKRVKELSPECQQLITFAIIGYSDTEIASKLGVSKAAISQRRDTIRRNLESVVNK